MSDKTIRYAAIVRDTIVDGLGLRDTLYVSYCPHNCPGCHNKALQNKNYGQEIKLDELLNILLESDNHLTLSGGEPMEQAYNLALLVHEYKKYRPNNNIWVYSGYTFEQIIQDEDKLTLLKQCDILVDGKFEIDKKSLNLKFKGSSNQRIIDIKKSLAENKIIELDL